MPTPDKLIEAYNAWRRASDSHEQMMLAVTQGAKLDHAAMKQKIGEIAVLHETWTSIARDLKR
jgi:hypothetical protein